MPLATAALEVARSVKGELHLDTLRARNNLALLLVDAGKLEAVEPMYAELTRQWRDRTADDEASYLVVAINYAHLLEQLDRDAEAATILDALLTRARSESRRSPGCGSPAPGSRICAVSLADRAKSGMQTERARALSRLPKPGR